MSYTSETVEDVIVLSEADDNVSSAIINPQTNLTGGLHVADNGGKNA